MTLLNRWRAALSVRPSSGCLSDREELGDPGPLFSGRAWLSIAGSVDVSQLDASRKMLLKAKGYSDIVLLGPQMDDRIIR